MTSQKGVCEGRLTVGHLPDYFQKKLMPRGQSRCFFFFFWGGGGGRLEVGILMEGSRQTTLSVSDKSYLPFLLQCPFCGSTISFLFSFDAVYW